MRGLSIEGEPGSEYHAAEAKESVMKISTKIRYGVRVLVELARRRDEEVVTMGSIAADLGLSRKYLDTICTSFRIAGLVRTRRGLSGGHTLGRDPEEINLGEVLRVLDGPLSMVDCVGEPDGCARWEHCVTRDVWSDVTGAIQGVLDDVTLADLVRRSER